jgi:hypothetical protein
MTHIALLFANRLIKTYSDTVASVKFHLISLIHCLYLFGDT